MRHVSLEGFLLTLLYEAIRRIFRGSVKGLLILFVSFKLFSPLAGADESEIPTERIRTADSCATVAELNELRADTAKVARATAEALREMQKEFKRHRDFINTLAEGVNK